MPCEPDGTERRGQTPKARKCSTWNIPKWELLIPWELLCGSDLAEAHRNTYESRLDKPGDARVSAQETGVQSHDILLKL